MRISLFAFVRLFAFFTALFATACGDPNPDPSGPDSGVVIDATIPPTDSGAVCGIAERNMGAPIMWTCGGANGPGPDGVITAPEPVTTSLQVGPMPLTPGVCGAMAPGMFGWVPWTSLKFFSPTPQSPPDRFFVQLPNWTTWIRCSRL